MKEDHLNARLQLEECLEEQPLHDVSQQAALPVEHEHAAAAPDSCLPDAPECAMQQPELSTRKPQSPGAADHCLAARDTVDEAVQFVEAGKVDMVHTQIEEDAAAVGHTPPSNEPVGRAAEHPKQATEAVPYAGPQPLSSKQISAAVPHLQPAAARSGSANAECENVQNLSVDKSLTGNSRDTIGAQLDVNAKDAVGKPDAPALTQTDISEPHVAANQTADPVNGAPGTSTHAAGVSGTFDSIRQEVHAECADAAVPEKADASSEHIPEAETAPAELSNQPNAPDSCEHTLPPMTGVPAVASCSKSLHIHAHHATSNSAAGVSNGTAGQRSCKRVLHACIAKKRTKKQQTRAVAQAVAQQERALAAASRRGVLGACGEIVARGPLQLPWCLYWSEDAAGPGATSSVYPAGNWGDDTLSQGAGKNPKQHGVAATSPGTLSELHERVQRLSAAVQAAQNQAEARFSECKTPAVLVDQHGSAEEVIQNDQLALEPTLLQELSSTVRLQNTHEVMATLKRTCEVLAADSRNSQACEEAADVRQVQADQGAPLLLWL
jgi:hypothetical protein